MEEPGPDRNYAIGGLLLLLTSFWLPWWVIKYADGTGHVYETVAPRLFAPHEPTTTIAPHITGVVVAVVVLALFVRTAGRSWFHEPHAWVRSLGSGAAALVLAAASGLFWPDQVPGFWAKTTYTLTDSGDTFTETALPGISWWLTLVAAGLLGFAWWQAKQTVGDATDK